jgi:PDZ domain-containing protein
VSRRALTQLLGVGLAVLLAVGGAAQTVPYVVLSPGPAFDTLGTTQGGAVLVVKGRPTYPTDGTLDLTTVSVRDGVTMFEALRGWLSRSDAVVPRELVIPPGQSRKKTDEENAAAMVASQDAATTAALRQLGLPFHVEITIRSVTKGAPADGHLQAGDVVTHVDGRRVGDAAELRKEIGTRKPGEDVEIGYTRKGKAATATLSTVASTAPVRPIIGVTLDEVPRFGVTVEIKLKDVGGPSAGLMFALGILEKLGKESLTGGRRIAGTGEITAEGVVGPIGGIPQKMLGARKAGAQVFLVPKDNCAEAKGARHEGLQLVKVGTLKEALSALATLRRGGTPPSC